MAARATKAVKKTASQAAANPPRTSGKPKARASKHSATPKGAVKTASKPAKAQKPRKPKAPAAKAEETPKAPKTTKKAPTKRLTAKTAAPKTAKPAPKKSKAAKAATASAKGTKSVSVKPKAAGKQAKKKDSQKPAAQTVKKAGERASKAAKGVKATKKTARKEKIPSKAKASKAAAKVAAAGGTETSTPPAAKRKRIRRASAPPPPPTPPPPPPPGRILAKGVPLAPEPRSPAVEKQRLKEALAAREQASKQESLYEKAVKQFNRRKFARALPLFEQVAEGPQVALRDRARVYAQICRQRTEENKIQLRNAEDYYNYGVKLLNDRELDDAAAHLNEALRRNPRAAHAHYATAVLHALNHNHPGVYDSLKRAIELDPKNRHLALHDSDLSSAKRDPAIYELLHSNVFAPPAS